MNIEQFLTDKVAAAVSTLYGNCRSSVADSEDPQGVRGRLYARDVPAAQSQPQVARSHGDGDRRIPGGQRTPEIKAFNVIKGFLNLSLDSAFWAARLPGGRGRRHLRAGRTDGPYRNDRILVAQHQQAPAPGAHPQQPAGILRGADPQGQRQHRSSRPTW